MYKSRYHKASSRITRRSRNKKLFNLLVKIGVPVAILSGLVFLSRADFLQVKGFEVREARTISQDKVEAAAADAIAGNKFFFIPKSNIFLLNKDQLAASLTADFGRIAELKVDKKFWERKIELELVERTADFLWCSAEDACYSMNKEGLIFERSDFVPLGGASAKVIFRGVLEGEPLQQSFASAERMRSYSDFLGVLEDAGLEADSINIESSDKGVAHSYEADIIFDPGEGDLVSAAQNAALLIRDLRAKNPAASFEYIDIRFGNKLFYKLR